MKLRRRCMQTLGVSVKQLRRKLLELGARILHVQGSKPRDMALVMLSVSPGMEVGSGGHGGLGGGLEGDPSGGGAVVGGGGGGIGGGGEGATDGMQEAMVAAARDRAIRAGSVRQDLALDLPPRLQLPDGEERPYGAHTALHLRDPEQESEIYQKCVRPPPNRTVFDSESPPPYRSQSALLDAPERIVRCHSAGSSLLRVFRKFPSPGSSTPAVVVPPRRPTLSSYSESSSNLSNLSSLTVVPCETDESQQHQQHHHHHHQQPPAAHQHQQQHV
ncbi:Uncharacterized protein C18orf1 like protein [Habropoda laboriosa]|uniref:Uncharacterized protein C18orf1 like protein n=2 Tax=Habropoda laboriosa TaxID=597456 RepID=A0A0L7QT53_9HYME|nr:PREDICTED: WAS/WASL-interacting protein family member 1-like isoform X1 [Habropoda laboriosa]KOC61734.1 Uncharacterized protein C18orf1 like protein [Habropoda laboriosa]